MTAGISVDLGSAVPPYEQIRTQISSLIAVGSLAAGTRLPTVRSLAADLGIGTVVVGIPDDGLPAGGAVNADVVAAVDRYIAEGRAAGFDDGTLQGILRLRLGLSRLGR